MDRASSIALQVAIPMQCKQLLFRISKMARRVGAIRFDSPAIANLTTVVNRAKEIASWRTRYDGNHLNQKGDWFTPIGGGPPIRKRTALALLSTATSTLEETRQITVTNPSRLAFVSPRTARRNELKFETADLERDRPLSYTAVVDERTIAGILDRRAI